MSAYDDGYSSVILMCLILAASSRAQRALVYTIGRTPIFLESSFIQTVYLMGLEPFNEAKLVGLGLNS